MRICTAQIPRYPGGDRIAKIEDLTLFDAWGAVASKLCEVFDCDAQDIEIVASAEKGTKEFIKINGLLRCTVEMVEQQ